MHTEELIKIVDEKLAEMSLSLMTNKPLVNYPYESQKKEFNVGICSNQKTVDKLCKEVKTLQKDSEMLINTFKGENKRNNISTQQISP